MHLVDCAGVASLLYGGILFLLCSDARVGNSRAARLRAINERREEHYDNRPGVSRLPNIWWGNVVADGWAVLHGPIFKAAILRHAAPFFSELVQHYCTAATARDTCLCHVASSLDAFYNILYSGNMFLTPAALCRLRAVCDDFGLHYGRLRALCARSALFAFPNRPKINKLLHMPDTAASINPRHCQCYDEESAVGSVAATWKGSKYGRYHSTVQRVVLVKRIVALLLRFELACDV